jgi:hypothetical protein
MNDKEFEKWKKKRDREKKETNKIIRNFANEIFKRNPKIEGISIHARENIKKKKEFQRINGIYIENENFAKKQDGEKK